MCFIMCQNQAEISRMWLAEGRYRSVSSAYWVTHSFVQIDESTTIQINCGPFY